MIDKTLEEEYIETATEYIADHLGDFEEKEAVFMAGVQYGLDLRDQKLGE